MVRKREVLRLSLEPWQCNSEEERLDLFHYPAEFTEFSIF
jgi:hypothetical protein